jgi:hypothetical protein
VFSLWKAAIPFRKIRDMMTFWMTITIITILCFGNPSGDFLVMSKILSAIKLRIHEIVLKEQRPFTLSDLKTFEIGGKKYEISYGTLRNNISTLVRTGFVEPAFRSKPAFYTIPGKKFNRTMTLDHTGYHLSLLTNIS